MLEKSDFAHRTGPKPFRSITSGETTVDRLQATDQTNPDCTEIDFNLTQLNQTSMIKNSQLPPAGKSYTHIEQIDEDVNEGEASAKRQPDSAGTPANLEHMKRQMQASLSFDNPNIIGE